MEISYFGEYYVWADNRIIESLVNITEEELITKKNEPDGRSIRHMIEHIASSYEMVFETPASQEEYKKLMEKIHKYAFEELLSYWKTWVLEFAKSIENDNFPVPSNSPVKISSKSDHIFAYSDHSTYHRGQLVMLLNMTGNKAVNTDYFTFLMEKTKSESS